MYAFEKGDGIVNKYLEKYYFDGTRTFKVEDLPTDSSEDGQIDKEALLLKTAENQEKIFALQDRLYAEGKEGLLIVIQARDAAGKDSTIRYVMKGVNPQGVVVTSYKQPSKEELSHDFLWRCHKNLPARGMIGIFNRSYYEDVLVTKVDHLQNGYRQAKRTLDMSEEEFYYRRNMQLKSYEDYLYWNSYRILKIFLNVSWTKQGERFMERIERPEKNWKFSYTDLNGRSQWDEYNRAYEDAINVTATPESPWYVIPGDQKWYARYLISEAILAMMEEMDPQYPVQSEAELERFTAAREQLMKEGIHTMAQMAEEKAKKAEKKAAKLARKQAKKDKKKEKADKDELIDLSRLSEALEEQAAEELAKLDGAEGQNPAIDEQENVQKEGLSQGESRE